MAANYLEHGGIISTAGCNAVKAKGDFEARGFQIISSKVKYYLTIKEEHR